MNKYVAHLYIIPEDDADRQLAEGFVLHHQVRETRVKIMPPAGGWGFVLKTFKDEYVKLLHENQQGHVVLLIDFDGNYMDRRAEFDREVPADLKPRVFVLGSKQNPEVLKKELKAAGTTLEGIGLSLADDCYHDTGQVWDQEHLRHNGVDRQRLISIVKPFLFES